MRWVARLRREWGSTDRMVGIARTTPMEILMAALTFTVIKTVVNPKLTHPSISNVTLANTSVLVTTPEELQIITTQNSVTDFKEIPTTTGVSIQANVPTVQPMNSEIHSERSETT